MAEHLSHVQLISHLASLQSSSMKPASKDTADSLHINTEDASVSISEHGLSGASLASWQTIATEPYVQPSLLSRNLGDTELRKTLLRPMPVVRNTNTAFDLLQVAPSTWRLVLRSMIPLASSYLLVTIAGHWATPGHNAQADTYGGDVDPMDSSERAPSRDGYIIDAGGPLEQLHMVNERLIPDSAVKSHEYGAVPQQYASLKNLLPSMQSPTRTLPTATDSTRHALPAYAIYLLAATCAVSAFLWMRWASNSARVPRRKYVIVKKRTPTPVADAASRSEEDESLEDLNASKATVKPSQQRHRSETPKGAIRPKKEAVDVKADEICFTVDSPRRSPRLAKKAIDTAASQPLPSRVWKAKCAQAAAVDGSPRRLRTFSPGVQVTIIPKLEEDESKPLFQRKPEIAHTHIVRLHGSSGVGKSSVIRSARSLDLPEEKSNMGISVRRWTKDNRTASLVFCDSDVNGHMWQAWKEEPQYVRYKEEQGGRAVHLVVYSDDVRVSRGSDSRIYELLIALFPTAFVARCFAHHPAATEAG